MRKKILTTLVAGVFVAGAFAAGAAADGTTSGDVRQAREEMHDQMGGDAMGAMRAMHEALDPAVMDAMHDEMVEGLPPELREDADAMHRSMSSGMSEGDLDHEAHHPTGS